MSRWRCCANKMRSVFVLGQRKIIIISMYYRILWGLHEVPGIWSRGLEGRRVAIKDALFG
jgi:hypothetical protein